MDYCDKIFRLEHHDDDGQQVKIDDKSSYFQVQYCKYSIVLRKQESNYHDGRVDTVCICMYVRADPYHNNSAHPPRVSGSDN